MSGARRHTRHGVPARDVVRDYAGRRTYDTCYRAGAIFGVQRAILITQRFHLYRAMYTCDSLGLDVVGLAADRRAYGSEPYYWLRDAVATLAAWFDVTILRPEPVLGDQIDIGLSSAPARPGAGLRHRRAGGSHRCAVHPPHPDPGATTPRRRIERCRWRLWPSR